MLNDFSKPTQTFRKLLAWLKTPLGIFIVGFAVTTVIVVGLETLAAMGRDACPFDSANQQVLESECSLSGTKSAAAGVMFGVPLLFITVVAAGAVWLRDKSRALRNEAGVRHVAEIHESPSDSEKDKHAKFDPKNRFSAVPWGPWVAVLYALLIYFVAQFVAGLALFVFPSLKGWSEARISTWMNTTQIQFVYYAIAEALTFAATWWFIRLRGGTLRMIGWRRIRLTDPLATLGGFAVYFLLYAAVLALATALVPSLNVSQKQQLGFDAAQQGPILILTFLSLVVMPPVVEELVFRGFVFSGIRTKLKPVGAALVTSALFAVAHLQFGSGAPLLWVAAIDTFILSLVLCYLRHKTDSLWPGILLHALKNGIAFVTLFVLHAH